MLKKYRSGLADKKQMENFVEQDALVLNPKGSPTPQLTNLFVRPSMEKKRVQGAPLLCCFITFFFSLLYYRPPTLLCLIYDL
jgi:hypothetical protein